MEWEELLSAAGVPAARILTVDKALALEQLAERGFITELEMPGGLPRTLGVVGNGALFDGEPVAPMLPPPLLGEHNAEVLSYTVDDTDSAAPEETP